MAADQPHVTPAANRLGGGRDLTTGPITRTLLIFALPTLGSNILQSLNGSINAIWIGRFLGEDALASASNTAIVMFLAFAAVFGFGMATTILIGQSVGRNDIDAARRALGSAVGLILGIGVLVAVLGWQFAPALLHALATAPEVYPLALDYLRVIFIGMPASFLTVLLVMALRGVGDSLTPLWFMILSALIDVGLNPVLIAGMGPFPALGIAGSAFATLVANVVTAAGLVIYIQLRGLPLRLRGREWRYLLPDAALARLILAKGLPMGLQMLVLSSSALAMVGLVNRFGVDTTAGYGVASQLWTYIQMPAMAIGAAVSAMAAQNIGADRWDRVSRITRSGVAMNMVMTGALVVIVTLFDRPLIGLFLPAGSPAIPIAEHVHLIAGWSFVLFGVTFVLSGTVRANGAVIAPLVILAIVCFPVRLGIALVAMPALGADAIWWSFAAGSVAAMVLMTGYYFMGGWRRQRLAVPPAHPAEQAHPVV